MYLFVIWRHCTNKLYLFIYFFTFWFLEFIYLNFILFLKCYVFFNYLNCFFIIVFIMFLHKVIFCALGPPYNGNWKHLSGKTGGKRLEVMCSERRPAPFPTKKTFNGLIPLWQRTDVIRGPSGSCTCNKNKLSLSIKISLNESFLVCGCTSPDLPHTREVNLWQG